jgi:L-ascorbate metabolism protein UlaG (beta-lactamase superfamily)
MRIQSVRLVMLVILLAPIVSACVVVTPVPSVPSTVEAPAVTETPPTPTPTPSAEVSTADIHWLIHDAFRFEGDGLVVYTDPYLLSGGEAADLVPADLILITHDHRDHCSPDDIAMIQKEDTVIVTTAACAEKLSGNIQVVAPGDQLEVKGIPIQAVPAYNMNKFRSEGVPYHPEGMGVGYVFTIGGQRIYHAGDTDVIPEMSDIDVDIALLPVSGLPYVMTADEAVEAAGVIKTRLVIPMHIGRTEESLAAAEAFKAQSPVPVEVLVQEIPPPPTATPAPSAEVSTADIHWLGHDAFRFEGDGLVVYTDPFTLTGGEPAADLILITHDHGDHCSPDDVAVIQKEDTVIVTTAACAEKLSGDIRVVAPGDQMEVLGIPIQAVPAYNVNKFRSEGVPYHPEGMGVGYIFTIGGQRIYHAGDTDVIPEMSDIDVDIALLPVSGTYVMTAEEAVQAAGIIKTRAAIPMHVGRMVGALSDADYFKANASMPVEILPLEE